MDVSTAKALLQRKEGATSVYDHLKEIVLKVITDQPANAVTSFEAISANIKAGAFPSTGPEARVGGDAGLEEHNQARIARIKAHNELLKVPGGEEGTPGEPVQDLLEDAYYLEWAGVSFGRTDMYRLHLSMKHLAAKFPVRALRFWGKLLGVKGDYIVVEGEMDAEGEEDAEAKDGLGNTIQLTGQGPNKYTYFVCHNIGDEWTKLPNVTPHQIVVARKARRFLTGDLAAPVGGHPPFPGNEANYARSLIAIISAATVLAPSGAFTAVEDDEEGAIAPNEEEWEAPDMTQPDSWVHHRLDLNTLGRTRPNPPKMGDDGEEVADPDAPEPSAPLKGITEDAPVEEEAEEGGGAWDVRPVPYGAVAEGESAGIVTVRSLRFPGAVTVGYQKKRCVSVYVGFGHGVTLKPHQPDLPAAAPKEYDFMAEETRLAEKGDVTKDPDEGKPAEGEEGEGEEEE